MELIELSNISKYAGERFDLIQAGGGNTSVKLNNGEMLIKSSGKLLSEVSTDSGYSKVITKSVSEIIDNKDIRNLKSKKERENLAAQLIKESTIDKKNRPSIETLLHSILLKYTLHTHPVVVNMIMAQKDYQKIINKIFDKDEFITLTYQTPGIDLAIELCDKLSAVDYIPSIIFLQNHGLIVTSNCYESIKSINEYVINKIERYIGIDMYVYKIANTISSIFNELFYMNNVTYRCEDYSLNELLKLNREVFFTPPFCPDTFVFCGFRVIELKKLEDVNPLTDYLEQYKMPPKVLIYKEHILINSINIKKAKEIEQILKFHILISSNLNKERINFLEEAELKYLSNWEAEKYRQKL